MQGNTHSQGSSRGSSCVSPSNDDNDDHIDSSLNRNGSLKNKKPHPAYMYQISHDKSDFYKMNHRRRGTFVILNNSRFAGNSFTERKGSNEEVRQLEDTFTKLGFDVRIHSNLSKSQIVETMEKVAKEDHSNCDCFGMAILTHGETFDMLRAYDGVSYYISDIYKIFNGNACQSLLKKPKLFFINACKGEEKDEVDEVCTRTELDCVGNAKLYVRPVGKLRGTPPEEVITSHAYSDFLCAHSTWQGYMSYHNAKHGSPYVYHLCNELLIGAKHKNDLTIILARVARRMAESVPMEGKTILRQTSWFQSSLIKNVVLRHKKVVKPNQRTKSN